jgi:hypothetical protein
MQNPFWDVSQRCNIGKLEKKKINHLVPGAARPKYEMVS